MLRLSRLAPAAAAAVGGIAAATAVSLSDPQWSPDGFRNIDLSSHVLDHHFLHTALAGEDKLEEYKLSISKDRQRLRAIARLGRAACGHPHIIHGGAIASLLDDAMGSLFLSTGLGTGFTANLNVDYRRPLPAGTDVEIQCSVDRVEEGSKGSKKVYIKAIVLNAESRAVHTEAVALFVVKPLPAALASKGSMIEQSGATASSGAGSSASSEAAATATAAASAAAPAAATADASSPRLQ